MKFSDQLRAAIREVGDNRWLAERADCDSTTITRFLRGERQLSTRVLDRLLPHLPIETRRKKRKAKR